MVPVTELMTPDPIVVEGGTPVAECARLMVAHDIRHLPVVDPDGRATGLITDWAVFQRGAMVGRDCWAALEECDQWLLARELARPIEVAVRPDDSAAPTLRALLRAFQDVAVVLDDDDHPVGIVTEHDAVRLCARFLDDDLWSTELPAREPTTVSWDASVRRALASLTRCGGRHLLVTRGDALRGVLSYRDVRREPWLTTEMRVGDILRRTPPEYVIGAVSLRYAAQVMEAQSIGCLPVVDRDLRPLRLLTRADVVRAALPKLEGEATSQTTSSLGWLSEVS